MNKYHKYKSESGILPGWVKVGALAMGVGVGTMYGPVPGGGVSKAWAGSYRLEVEACSSVGGAGKVRGVDLVTGGVAEYGVSIDGVALVKKEGDGFEGFTVLPCDNGSYSCKFGSFCVSFNLRQHKVFLYGGSANDDLCISSDCEVELPLANRVRARNFVFDNIATVRIGTRVLCDFVAFSGVRKLVICEGASFAVSGGIFVASGSIENKGQLTCGFLSSYGNCVFENKGLGSMDSFGCKGVELSFLQGFDPSLGLGCFVDRAEFPFWYPCHSEPQLPFYASENIRIKRHGEKRFYEIAIPGEYVFVFIGDIMDGCGNGHEHRKKVCFYVQDAKQNVLGRVVQEVNDAIGWKKVVCLLGAVLDCPKLVSFNLDNAPGVKCASSEIDYRFFQPRVAICKVK